MAVPSRRHSRYGRLRALALAPLVLALVAADRAPPRPLELGTLDGAPVSLAPSGAGQTLVVHFWASWCPSCRDELPALARAAAGCDASRVRVVAVNVAEPAQLARRFADEIALALPVLLDPHGRAWRGLGLRALPANLFWEPSQAHTEEGPGDERAWRARLAVLGCDAAPREDGSERSE